MSSKSPGVERRRWPRAEVPAVAHLVRSGQWLGGYAVEDLSAGGVAVLGAPSFAPGTELEVILHVVGRTPLALAARVARAPTPTLLALEFLDASSENEDSLQSAVLEYIAEEASTEADPIALIVDDHREVRAAMARELSAMGIVTVEAQSPLEAVRAVEESDREIRFAIVDLALGRADGTDFLAWLADEHASVRRILMSGVLEPEALRAALLRKKAHAILKKPWTREQLRHALYGAQPGASKNSAFGVGRD